MLLALRSKSETLKKLRTALQPLQLPPRPLQKDLRPKRLRPFLPHLRWGGSNGVGVYVAYRTAIVELGDTAGTPPRFLQALPRVSGAAHGSAGTLTRTSSRRGGARPCTAQAHLPVPRQSGSVPAPDFLGDRHWGAAGVGGRRRHSGSHGACAWGQGPPSWRPTNSSGLCAGLVTPIDEQPT